MADFSPREYIMAEIALFVVWLSLVFLTFGGCGDNLPTVPRYWSCTEQAECSTGADCITLLRGESYCTTTCVTTDDCLTYGWPAVCSDGYCYGECFPGATLEFCRRYGFLCPSDCEMQGLVCGPVAGAPLPRYGCVKRYTPDGDADE